MRDETDHASGTQGASAAEREIYMIACGQHADAHRAALDRIAALDATVARMTAPVTDAELRQLDDELSRSGDDTIEAYRGALTAFLDRRMKR